jgi:plastocyanin
MRKVATYVCIVTVGIAGLAGCSSDSGGGGYVAPTGPPVKTIKLSAKNFAFGPAKVSSPAGIIQFDVESTDGIHDLVIEGQPGFQIEVSGSGSKASGKIKLAKGKYTFYCDISGHRAQGMEGTLTVT